MSALCCCYNRQTHHDQELSTWTAQLPARPAKVKLSKPRLRGHSRDESTVKFNNTQAPSLMTTPRTHAVLDPTLFEVDDSGSEDEQANQKRSPTSTLGALKTKLIRRLSQSSQTKRQSQHNIGDSREEVARRAELRRLRQRRIKEELETEEKVETKSNESGPPKSGSSVPMDIPGGGPRDDIEFSVCEANEIDSDNSSTPAQEMVALALPLLTGTGTSVRRRSSCPSTAAPSRETSLLRLAKMPRERGSLPDMPISPELESAHVSDIRASSSIASWRLSYSAGHLVQYFGTVKDEGPEKEDSVTNSSEQKLKPGMYCSESAIEVANAKESAKQSRCSAKNHSLTDQDIISASSTMTGADQEVISSPDHSIGDDTQFEQSTGILNNTTNTDHNSPLDLWLRVSNTLQSLSHSSTRRNSDSVLENRPDGFAVDNLKSTETAAKGTSSSASSTTGAGVGLLKVPGSFPAFSRSGTISVAASHGSRERKNSVAVSLDMARGSAAQNSSSSRYTTQSSGAELSVSVSKSGSTEQIRKQRSDQSGAFNSESYGVIVHRLNEN